MTFKKIPRGKGRAPPKHVLPEDHITKTDLLQQIQLAENGLNDIEQLDAQCYFKHPLFAFRFKRISKIPCHSYRASFKNSQRYF